MAEDYPITTSELVVIGLKEIGKDIPILGSLIKSHQAVFAKIESNRIRGMLTECVERIEKLEAEMGLKPISDERTAAVLAYAAEQARSDILGESKAKEYGAAAAHFAMTQSDYGEVFEVFDAIRRLSAVDLKLLRAFKAGDELWENRLVAELAGFTGYTNPYQQQHEVRANMEMIYPSLMRLEGFGVVFLSYDQRQGGHVMPNIGGLSEHLKKSAFLTEVGKKLVKALPNS